MKSMKQFSTKALEQAAKSLEHAKTHRQGGLLRTEQAALDGIDKELARRFDKEAQQ